MEKIYETGYVYYFYHNDVVKYVGSTKNFKRRIKKHKEACYNLNSASSNYPLYQYIRDTDAWDNFEFKIEFTYHNITLKELEKHEADRILEFGLNNLLNCKVPGRTAKEWHIANRERENEISRKYWKNNNYYENNKKTIIKRAEDWKNDNISRVKANHSQDWYCELCDTTVRLYKKSRHIKTKSHQSNLHYSNLFHLSPNIFN